ncbi:hypothetical protein V6246_05260 [Algibacter sp. TI.3.09]|uniref:hypothetical protein n=1 Tax=Algibacter sp. TI.3.09 TaxID=3121298 RepID=UPI00311DE9C6
MPTATQSDDNSISLTSSGLDVDEFIPLVSFKRDGLKNINISEEIFEYEEEKISHNKDEDNKLSKHIDYWNSRTYRIFERVTKKEKITFPLYITKGNEESEDDDGIITARLSEEIEGVKITSETDFKASYNSNYTLELELKGDKLKPFYVDFYAKDDEDDDWEIMDVTINDKTGKLKNVHCGRIKIVKKQACICTDTDWPILPNMVLDANKVRYAVTSVPWDNPECYHYALHQLSVLGYYLKSERWNKKWDGTKELNDYIYQLQVDHEVAGMIKGPQKIMFKKALVYLKKAMKMKTPVMIGLDYDVNTYANDDLITDHFAVITGCGKDSDGNLYFDVTDNAFKYQKYYCNCENFEISTKKPGSLEAKGIFRVSQVRESKKL